MFSTHVLFSRFAHLERRTIMNNKKKEVQVLRLFRKLHRWTGVFLFIFFFAIAITGLLLGWKSNSNGYILPETQKGTSIVLSEWLSLDSLYAISCQVVRDSIDSQLSLELNRIDVRKNKGLAKFVFEEGNWGVQLDGATGKVLQIGKRRSDLIENLHDGSFFDDQLGTKGKPIKLVYTTVLGLALILFTVTGFWLWYGPKRLKKKKS